MNPLAILSLLFSVSATSQAIDERTKLVSQIREVFDTVNDRDIVVQKVLETINSETENAYNIMVVNYLIPHEEHFKGVHLRKAFTFGLDSRYNVFVFCSGEFELKGDGGWINWGFSGNYTRNDNRVTFNSPGSQECKNYQQLCTDNNLALSKFQTDFYEQLSSQIENVFQSNHDINTIVQKVIDKANEVTGKAYNVMVVKKEVPHEEHFEGAQLKKHFKLWHGLRLNPTYYDVYVFCSGEFELKGDGGWINWGFSGNYTRNDNRVTFNSLGGNWCNYEQLLFEIRTTCYI